MTLVAGQIEYEISLSIKQRGKELDQDLGSDSPGRLLISLAVTFNTVAGLSGSF